MVLTSFIQRRAIFHLDDIEVARETVDKVTWGILVEESAGGIEEPRDRPTLNESTCFSRLKIHGDSCTA